MSLLALNLAGQTVHLECEHAYTEEAIRALWEPALRLPTTSPQVKMTIDASGQFLIDGELWHDDQQLEFRPTQVEHALLQSILSRRKEAVHLHAACLQFSACAVLFIGESGAGKSTLTREALKFGGGRYLSDDCILLQDARVYGVARTIQFDAIDLDLEIPAYFSDCDLVSYRVAREREQRMVVPLWREQIEVVQWFEPANLPTVVVRLKRGDADALNPLSGLQRLTILHESTITLGQEYSGEFGFGPTFELTWNDPAKAFALLALELKKLG